MTTYKPGSASRRHIIVGSSLWLAPGGRSTTISAARRTGSVTRELPMITGGPLPEKGLLPGGDGRLEAAGR